MENNIIRYTIIGLFLILFDVQVWANCGETPDITSKQEDVTEYAHQKVIFHSIDGQMKGSDSLTVWHRDRRNICFSITTVSDEYRTCYLEGKAAMVRKNEYSYTQNRCRVSFIFWKNKVKVEMAGSQGNFCAAEDLGEDNGCGMDTSIDSATYIKVKKK